MLKISYKKNPTEEAGDEGKRNERWDHSVQDEREAATPQQLLVFYENKGPFLLHWQELRQTHTILSPADLRSPLNKQLKAYQLRVLLSCHQGHLTSTVGVHLPLCLWALLPVAAGA